MRIYVTAPFDAVLLEKLREKHEVTYNPWSAGSELMSEQALHNALAQSRAEIFVCESDVVTAAVLEGLHDLKMICVCRAGINDIEIPAATERGILVTNTPGRNAEGVAEMDVALMIMCSRFMTQGEYALRHGQWDDDLYFRMRGPELVGKTVGLIGFGNVPRKLAALLASFRVKLIAYDPYVKQETADAYHVQMVDFDTIFKEADIVSNHLPQTPETKGCINAGKFAMMKPTAYFLNTARAEAVDEKALIDVLQNHKIAGAALDVYWQEPLPMDSPLLKLDNLTMMPHLCGASSDVVRNHSEMVTEDIERFAAGKDPIRLVNRSLAKT